MQTSRWQAVAGNPAASAVFYKILLDAVFKVALGWDNDKLYQSRPDCMFGAVTMAFAKHESAGRGAAHGHACLVQPALQSDALMAALEAGGSVKQHLLEFIESVAQCFLPAPFHSLDCTPSEKAVRPYNKSDGQEVNNVGKTGVDGKTIAARQIPLHAPTDDPASLVSHRRTMHAAAETVIHTQTHGHTHTCTKNGGEMTDKGCRMHYPRVVHQPTLMQYIAATPQSEATGLVLVHRAAEMLVTYNLGLLLGVGCNCAVELMCCQGRWERAVRLAEADHLPVPIPSSMKEACREACMYICKYSTKPAPLLNKSITEAALALKEGVVEGPNGTEPNGMGQTAKQRAQRALATAMNQVNAKQTVPAPMAAGLLLGHGDVRETYVCAPWGHTVMTARWMQLMGAAEPEDGGNAEGFELVQEGGRFHAVDCWSDFIFRDPALASLCPFVCVMYFRKLRKDDAFNRMHPHLCQG